MDEELDDIYSVQTPGTSVWIDKPTWLTLKRYARHMDTHEQQRFVEVTSVNNTEHAFFIDYATVFAHTTKAQRESIHGAMNKLGEELPQTKEPWE